jgi:hypothetical protein
MLLANKAGPTRLGFVVLLKVFGHDGRFPRSHQEVAGAVVVHLAKQVGVAADQYLHYDWAGRAIKYHRRPDPRLLRVPRGHASGYRGVSHPRRLTAWGAAGQL